MIKSIELLQDEWHEKEEELSSSGVWVAPKLFYREIFPVGSLEKAGNPDDEKPNIIAMDLSGRSPKTRLIFDDLDELDFFQGKKFAITSPVSYWGKRRTSDNARYIHGIAIDLDGVSRQNCRDCIYQMQTKSIPMATFIVNSGTGLHLYYVFNEPIPAYHSWYDQLNQYKRALTKRVWNQFTSSIPESEMQIQSIFQGFRVIGSLSKLGKDYPVTAYRIGDTVDMSYLDPWVNGQLRDEKKSSMSLAQLNYEEKMPMEQAKKLWPKWYEERIVQGKPKRPGKWTCNRGLYDWWREQIQKNGVPGHRYWCLYYLACYAVKCDISEDELYKDAKKLLPIFESRTTEETNHFTNHDLYSALKVYAEPEAYRARRDTISNRCGIPITPAKRNRRPQDMHLKIARFTRDLNYPQKDWNRSSRGKVIEWQNQHPYGSKKECVKDTGLCRQTVSKWWVEMTSVKPNENRVRRWRSEHPQGTVADCVTELSLSKTTVYRYWKS